MAAWFAGKWQCQKRKQMTDFESLESDFSLALDWGKLVEVSQFARKKKEAVSNSD